jgi:hypothetical protein
MAKTYIQTDDNFKADMVKLREINPYITSDALMIRLVVRHAAQSNFELIKAGEDHVTTAGATRRARTAPKESWCGLFGGELRNGVCEITKYEVLSSGQVRKSPRTVALSAFPVDREDFRVSVLGSFETLEDAELAFKKKPLL